MSAPALVGVIKAVPLAVERSARLMERLDEDEAARGITEALESMMRAGIGLGLEVEGTLPVMGRWDGGKLDIVIKEPAPLRRLLLPIAERFRTEIVLGIDEPVEILLLFEIWRPFLLALARHLEGKGVTVLLRYRDLPLVKTGRDALPVLSERYGKTEVYMSHLFKLLSDLFG